MSDLLPPLSNPANGPIAASYPIKQRQLAKPHPPTHLRSIQPARPASISPNQAHQALPSPPKPARLVQRQLLAQLISKSSVHKPQLKPCRGREPCRKLPPSSSPSLSSSFSATPTVFPSLNLNVVVEARRAEGVVMERKSRWSDCG